MMRVLLFLAMLAVLGFPNVQHVSAQNCTLCADGSNPPEDLMDVVVFEKLVEGVNLTCAGLMAEAEAQTTTDGCEKMQREGVALCQCPSPDAEDSCTLCQSGQPLPEPELEFVKSFPCSTIASYIQSDDRPGACAAYQATVGVYCKCDFDPEESTAEVCRLCGDDKLLPEPGRFIEGGNTTGACSDLEFKATLAPDTCEDYRTTIGPLCCTEGLGTAVGGNTTETVVNVDGEGDGATMEDININATAENTTTGDVDVGVDDSDNVESDTSTTTNEAAVNMFRFTPLQTVMMALILGSIVL